MRGASALRRRSRSPRRLQIQSNVRELHRLAHCAGLECCAHIHVVTTITDVRPAGLRAATLDESQARIAAMIRFMVACACFVAFVQIGVAAGGAKSRSGASYECYIMMHRNPKRRRWIRLARRQPRSRLLWRTPRGSSPPAKRRGPQRECLRSCGADLVMTE